MSSCSDKASPTFDLNLITQTLSDRAYELVSEIGRGAFAVVYKCVSIRYNCDFAVKITMAETSPSADRQREIDLLLSLGHPNIIRMYEHFVAPPYAYIVLEYCAGGSLDSHIRKHGPLSFVRGLHLCRQICSALRYCHEQGIAHRDIKPANILLDQYGRPRLADFGLSTSWEQGSLLRVNAGSRAFMPPEMIESRPSDPFKADIWALGLTIYYTFLGRLPWTAESPKELKCAISMGMIDYQYFKGNKEMVRLLKAMLDSKMNKRPDMEWVCKQDIFSDHQAFRRTSVSTACLLKPNGQTVSGPLGLTKHRSKDTFGSGVPLIPLRRISKCSIGPRRISLEDVMADNGTKAVPTFC